MWPSSPSVVRLPTEFQRENPPPPACGGRSGLGCSCFRVAEGTEVDAGSGAVEVGVPQVRQGLVVSGTARGEEEGWEAGLPVGQMESGPTGAPGEPCVVPTPRGGAEHASPVTIPAGGGSREGCSPCCRAPAPCQGRARQQQEGGLGRRLGPRVCVCIRLPGDAAAAASLGTTVLAAKA